MRSNSIIISVLRKILFGQKAVQWVVGSQGRCDRFSDACVVGARNKCWQGGFPRPEHDAQFCDAHVVGFAVGLTMV